MKFPHQDLLGNPEEVAERLLGAEIALSRRESGLITACYVFDGGSRRAPCIEDQYPGYKVSRKLYCNTDMLHFFPGIGKTHITVAEVSIYDAKGDESRVLSPRELATRLDLRRYAQLQHVKTSPFSAMPFVLSNQIPADRKIVEQEPIHEFSTGLRFYLADIEE